jgi:hypothetical protein
MMLIRGEALVDTITVAFTISGQRRDWTITVTPPGGSTKEDQTVESHWHVLFGEMLADALEVVRNRRHPERASVRAGR